MKSNIPSNRIREALIHQIRGCPAKRLNLSESGWGVQPRQTGAGCFRHSYRNDVRFLLAGWTVVRV